MVEFLHIPGLGPKTVRKIWQELGVTTLAELKDAARAERLRTLPGLGAKTEESILKSTARKKKATGPPRALLGQALPALLAVVEVLREHPAADRVSEAGSARRRKETVRDLDIIATASDPKALTEYFTQAGWVSEVVAKGPTKATVVSHEGFRFDLRVVPPESYGNLLQHFTGSKEHNLALREDAQRRGFSVSEYGITEVESGEVFTAESEEEVYERLGYEYIPPELRENAGRARGGAQGRAAAAGRAGPAARRPAHALALVGRRQEHARGDGRGRARRAATPTTRSPTTRTTCARAGWSSRRRRSTSWRSGSRR